MSHGQSKGNKTSASGMRGENNLLLLCGATCSLSVHECHGNPSPGLVWAGGIKVGGAGQSMLFLVFLCAYCRGLLPAVVAALEESRKVK